MAALVEKHRRPLHGMRLAAHSAPLLEPFLAQREPRLKIELLRRVRDLGVQLDDSLVGVFGPPQAALQPSERRLGGLTANAREMGLDLDALKRGFDPASKVVALLRRRRERFQRSLDLLLARAARPRHRRAIASARLCGSRPPLAGYKTPPRTP